MEKIKILWIITGGIRRNGICVSQLDYFKKIDKEKFQIDIVAVHNNTQEMIDKYVEAGCKVYTLTDRRKNLFKYLKELKELIKKEKYNIVHVHGSSTLMSLELGIAKKCNVPVRIAHSRNTTCDRPYLECILRRKFDKSYNYALACGNDAGKWLFKDKEFTVFHNGKDLDKYKFNVDIRKEYRQKLNIKDNEIAIGHVGLFNEQKNHTFLIDVFNEIVNNNDNVKLFLIGTGPNVEKIQDKVNKLNIQDKVIFCGSVSNVQDYLQAMDVMMFPSLFEGLPNVVIEWEAAGLPVLISNKITTECIISDIVKSISIDDGTQVWIKNFEKTKILNEEERLLKSKDNCNKLIENGFEINNNTKKIEELYLKLVSKEKNKNVII